MSVFPSRDAVARLPKLGSRITIHTVPKLTVLFVTLLLASSCSILSGSGNKQGSSSTSGVAVRISPPSAQIAPSGTVQFSASVSGTSNVAVTWSATGGSISPNGLFTASKTGSGATITATSVASPAAAASAAVVLSAPANLRILSTSIPAAQTEVPYSATMSSSGGLPPYTWSVSSGVLPQGLGLSSRGTISGTPVQVGTYSFTLKVTDSASQTQSLSENMQVTAGSNLNYSGFDGPAELPRVYLQTALADTPAPGSTITVNAGGNLQSALNSANCGDTILLQSGAVFSGNFQIPAKACDDQHWIIVRTSAPDSSLPAESTRINPCYAGVASLPGRPAFTCTAVKNVMAQILYTANGISGPLQLLDGANHYRFIGLEITRALPTVHMWDLVAPMESTYSADHLIFDRVWVHGTATDETKGGIHLSGVTNAAVIDSYFTDFHCISNHGSCTDAQAIGGGEGSLPAGPYKIDNNFLEASAQSIMFGGGAGTTTPTDLEIRYNHMFKPLLWQPGAAGFVGGYTGDPYIVKNHFELKNAQRVLFEGNILENVWGGFTQAGYSVVLTPKTQNGVCIPCQVTDITIRYNQISNVGGGFDIGNVEDKTGGFAVAGERYSIHDVLLENVNMAQFAGDGELATMISSSTSEILSQVSMQHITAFPDVNSHILSIEDTVSTMPGLVFANNLVVSSPYPIVSAGGGNASCAASDVPLTVVQTCFPGYVFTGNLVVGSMPNYPSSKWPAGQTFLASVSSVGFVNYAGGNYALSASSPYVGKATDGRNIGADITGLTSMIAGVQ